MSIKIFQMPKKVSMEKSNNFHGIFTFQPLESGYGITIGNALRRVLLSSIEGYAITSIKIDGINHEFSTINGITEDIIEIILNLKKVRFKKIIDIEEEKISIQINKSKFKAKDIEKSASYFKIINPELIICNLNENIKLNLDIKIKKGRGYVSSEENKDINESTGTIAIDSILLGREYTVHSKVEKSSIAKNRIV